jgi:Flavoprotein
MASRTLYFFGSAAPPVLHVAEPISAAQADGWDVCLGLTPMAAEWLGEQIDELEQLTRHPVRSSYKRPGQPDVWPPADAIVLAPATFNTINQWAAGITSTFVIGVVAEAIGKRIPITTMPCVNRAYVEHPAFDRSIDTLRDAGVNVLYGPGGFEPNEPGQGRPAAYPWHLALRAIVASDGRANTRAD